MDEFSLIDLLASALGAKRGALEGIGDDAAILDVPEGMQLLVSTDTLVEGVHFDSRTSPADLGYKSLAVNLSDLAAMGATPAWYFLALTLPAISEDWIRQFAQGMREMADESGIRLAGGDTTLGPLNITVTVCGLVARGAALTRGGACAGDVIGISGPTGLAGRALDELKAGREPDSACSAALFRPKPRNDFGCALVGLARSCIDVSDGLLADSGHLAEASGLGTRIELSALPIPEALADMSEEARWALQLSAGDDYELCFTVDPDRWGEVLERGTSLGLEPTIIGRVLERPHRVCVRPDGSEFRPPKAGYVHGAVA